MHPDHLNHQSRKWLRSYIISLFNGGILPFNTWIIEDVPNESAKSVTHVSFSTTTIETMPPSEKAVNTAMDLVRIMARTQNPGFAHMLGVNIHRTEQSRFSWCNDTLSMTYRHPFDLFRPSSSNLLALMDEYVWMGQLVAKPDAPIGVSLNLRLQWANPSKPIDPNLKELDIRNTMAHMGRSTVISHTDFIDPASNELVAFGSQVKYVANGEPVDIEKYLQLPLPDKKHENPLLKEYFRNEVLSFGAPGRATLKVDKTVSNGWGSLHVCQYMTSICISALHSLILTFSLVI